MKSILIALALVASTAFINSAHAAPPFDFLGPKNTIEKVEHPGVIDHLDFNAEGFTNALNFEENLVVPEYSPERALLSLQDLNKWTEAGPDVFFNIFRFDGAVTIPGASEQKLVMPWMVEHGQFDKDPAADLAVINHLGAPGLWIGKNYTGQSAAAWDYRALSCGNVIFSESNVRLPPVLPIWVQVGDVNGDSNQDIVVSTMCGTLNTFLGDGNGNFAATPVVRFVNPEDKKGYIVWSFVLNKFDADNLPDIAAVAWNVELGPATLFLKGTAPGDFSAGSFEYVDRKLFECFGPTHIIAAKLNGDELSDLAVACPFGFKEEPVVTSTVGFDTVRADAVAVAVDSKISRFSNYAVLDTRKTYDGHVYVYLADTATTFGTPGDAGGHEEDQLLTKSVYRPFSVAAANFNSDGSFDLAVANVGDRDSVNHAAEGSITFHANDGSGKNFDDIDGTTYKKFMGFFPFYGFAADMNEDSRADYVVGSTKYLNLGSNFAIAATRIPRDGAVQVLLNTVPPDITVQEPSCSNVEGTSFKVAFKVYDADAGDEITTVDVTVAPGVDASKVVKSTLPAKDVSVTVELPISGNSKVKLTATDKSGKTSDFEYSYTGQLANCGATPCTCPAKPITLDSYQYQVGNESICLDKSIVGQGNDLKWTQTTQADKPGLKFGSVDLGGMPAAADNCLNFACQMEPLLNDFTVQLKYEIIGANGSTQCNCDATVNCLGLKLFGMESRCSLSKLEPEGGYSVFAMVAAFCIPLAGIFLMRKRLNR